MKEKNKSIQKKSDINLLNRSGMHYFLKAIAVIYGFPEFNSLDIEYTSGRSNIETAIYLAYYKGEYYQLKLEYQHNAPMYGWPVSQFTLYHAVFKQGYEVEFEQVEYYDAGALEELVDKIAREKNKAPA